MRVLQYFATLKLGKQVLWCYLIWYLVTVAQLFDPSPRIWINSAGISAIIGFALLLSVSGNGANSANRDRWQLFRLFMMPFGVSSFSTLIKGQGYIFIFPTTPALLSTSIVACTAFVALVFLAKQIDGRKTPVPASSSDASQETPDN